MLLRLLRFQRDLALETMKFTVNMVGTVVGIPAFAAPFLASLFQTNGESVTYPFLSPEWIDAARKIREEYRGRNTQTPPPLKVNQVVTGVPFGDGTIEAHTDTTSGDLEMDLGFVDGAELQITLDYETAKKILVEQNPQAAMQAFMSGQIKVEGDMTKLMAMQSQQPSDAQKAMAEKIKEITAP